jgi:putative transposase
VGDSKPVFPRPVQAIQSRPVYRKRVRHYNIPGHAHFVSFSCIRRQPLLREDRVCRWLADNIDATRQRHAFDLWAYVFMPEHVHLLFLPRRDSYSMSAILADIKRPVARKALDWVRQNDPDTLHRYRQATSARQPRPRFWQVGGGYDRNLESAETVWNAIHYIHTNPVTRGLVTRCEDWRWSSAADYLTSNPGPLMVDLNTVPERKSEY